MIKPIGNRILVERLPGKEKTSGGILLPDQLKTEMKSEFLVLRVGSGRRTRKGCVVPIEVKPGNHILANTYAGQEIVDGDKVRRLMEASSVDMVI